MALFTEGWTGDDGDPWPADWTHYYDVAVTTDIQSNRGRASGSGSPEGVSLVEAVDVVAADARVIIQLNTGETRRYGLMVRVQETGNPRPDGYLLWYANDQSSDKLRIFKFVDGDGSSVVLASTTAHDSPADADYQLRLQAEGTALRARMWLDADPEPETWDIETTDSEYGSSGMVGLYSFWSSGLDVVYDDYEVADLSGTAAVSGSGGSTAAAATSSGTGTVTVAGSGASTGPAPSTTGSGAVTVSGSGVSTGPAATSSGSGQAVDTVAGSGSSTGPAATSSGAGSVTASGAGASVGPAATSSGTGSASDVATGSGASVGPSATSTGTGSVIASGAGASTATPATSAGTGSATVSGSGGSTIVAPTSDGTGAVVITGSGASIGPAPTSDGNARIGETITPASRTLVVEAEDRTLVVAAETRVLEVAAEDRTLRVRG